MGFFVSPAVMAMDSVPPSRKAGQWVEKGGGEAGTHMRRMLLRKLRQIRQCLRQKGHLLCTSYGLRGTYVGCCPRSSQRYPE